MLGLFLLFCVVAVMGFILAWITGIVANEEVSIGTAMLVVFTSAILSGLASFGVGMAGFEGLLGSLAGLAVWFGAMTLMLMSAASIKAGKAALVSVIFSVLWFVALTVLAASLSVPGR